MSEKQENRKKGRLELQKEEYQNSLLAKNYAEVANTPENTPKSRQSGIKERKDEQAKLDKQNIDDRIKAAIEKIESNESSMPDISEAHNIDQPAKTPQKKKSRSLNSRLQNKVQKKDNK